MAAEPTVFQIDYSPKQVSWRLAFWWLLALLLLACGAWRFHQLRNNGMALTLRTAAEFAAIIAYWVYAVATYKLIISTTRAWSVELHDDMLLFHFLNRKEWQASYRDITEVSLHFGDWRCSYDSMELGIGTDAGPPGLTGGTRCRGEIMEALTAEIRRRVAAATGRDLGDAASDRQARLELAKPERRRQRTILAVLLPLTLLPLLAVELVAYQERVLETRGQTALGTITGIAMTPSRLRVDYVYGDDWGMDLRGRGDFALRSYANPDLGDVRAIQPGDKIDILYNPNYSIFSIPAHAIGKSFWLARALCLPPILIVLLLLFLSRRGRYFSFTRGIRLLAPDELPEDRIKK